jgi:hypothetical protein
VQAKESLRSQAQIAASQTEPQPESESESSQPVTIQLHPDTVVILAHALRNRSFYNLHQSIIDEILHALEGNEQIVSSVR